MPKHAQLSASAAHRWMNCTGSVAASAKVPPSPSSIYADEGTAAAFLAEMCLINNKKTAENYLNKWIGVSPGGTAYFKGDAQPKRSVSKESGTRFQVDVEMVDHIRLYLDTVWETCPKNGKMLIEYEVHLPRVHKALGGTIDVVTFIPWGKLTILDLKYGQGIVVEAEENHQLLIYLLGMSRLGIFDEFEIVVVQPRAHHPQGPVRRWTVSREYLEDFAATVKTKALEALSSGAPLTPGEKQCRWCPVSGKCPAQLQAAREIALMDFDPIQSREIVDPEELSIDRLAEIYKYKNLMANWFNDIGNRLKECLNLGEDVPGFKLVAGVGNRQWRDEGNAVKKLRRRGFTKNDIYITPEPQLKSPAQIEKLKKGKFNTKKGLREFVTTLTMRPEREAQLVADTDKRIEHQPARAEFDDLTASKGEDSWLTKI